MRSFGENREEKRMMGWGGEGEDLGVYSFEVTEY